MKYEDDAKLPLRGGGRLGCTTTCIVPGLSDGLLGLLLILKLQLLQLHCIQFLSWWHVSFRLSVRMRGGRSREEGGAGRREEGGGRRRRKKRKKKPVAFICSRRFADEKW